MTSKQGNWPFRRLMKARDSQPPFGVTNRTKNSSEAQATLLVWHMLKQSLHKSPQKQQKQTLSSLNMCFALNRPGVKISTERDWVTVWKKWDFPFFCISRVTPHDRRSCARNAWRSPEKVCVGGYDCASYAAFWIGVKRVALGWWLLIYKEGVGCVVSITFSQRGGNFSKGKFIWREP